MSRYPVPSNTATVGFLVLDKDDYEFVIGDAKTFITLDKETNEPRNWGVGFNLTVSGGPQDGKSLGQVRFYLHNEGSVRMTKGFLMAALGYTSSQSDEAEFNETYPDIGIDPDDNTMADVYTRCVGNRIRASVDVKPNPKREGEVQNSFRYYPVPK